MIEHLVAWFGYNKLFTIGHLSEDMVNEAAKAIDGKQFHQMGRRERVVCWLSAKADHQFTLWDGTSVKLAEQRVYREHRRMIEDLYEIRLLARGAQSAGGNGDG